MSELTAAQVMIIGFIATLIAQAINIYFKRRGAKPGRRWITVSLYVIAVVLAYLWARPLLPHSPAFPAPVEDPAAYALLIVAWLGAIIVFLGKLIAALSSIVGFATLVYNTLLKRVFEILGWGTDETPPTPAPES